MPGTRKNTPNRSGPTLVPEQAINEACFYIAMLAKVLRKACAENLPALLEAIAAMQKLPVAPRSSGYVPVASFSAKAEQARNRILGSVPCSRGPMVGLIASKACESCNINNYEAKRGSTILFRGIPPQEGDPQTPRPLQAQAAPLAC